MAAVERAADYRAGTALLPPSALCPDRRHRNFILRGAPSHGREPTPGGSLLAVACAALLVWLGDPSQRLSFACSARRLARAVHRRARLCRTADGHARIFPRTDHRAWAHGQMELPACGDQSWGGARDHASDAADLSRSTHADRARRSGARASSLPALACPSLSVTHT